MAITREQAHARLEAIREDYEAKNTSTFSALLMGLEGTGKTHSLLTLPKPCLINSFDPNGTLLIDVLKKKHDLKDVYVRQYWTDSYKTPGAFRAWERDWERDRKEGIFKHLGGYAIDSGTTFLTSLTWHLSKLKSRPDGTLAIQDYQILYNILKDIIRITQTSGCNFVFTGHAELDKSEEDGKIIATLAVYHKLKTQIPLLFTEKLVMMARPTGKDTDYYFLTQPEGYYRASTQLGAGGIFEKHEKPDFEYLIKKAGLDIKKK